MFNPLIDSALFLSVSFLLAPGLALLCLVKVCDKRRDDYPLWVVLGFVALAFFAISFLSAHSILISIWA